MSLRIHLGQNMALLQGEGTLSPNGWNEACRELVAEVGTGNVRRILSDRRRASDIGQPGIDDRMKEFIQEYRDPLKNVRWAIVVPDSIPGHVELSLRAAAQTAGVQLLAFTDLSEGLKWLLGVYEGQQVINLTIWTNATT